MPVLPLAVRAVATEDSSEGVAFSLRLDSSSSRNSEMAKQRNCGALTAKAQSQCKSQRERSHIQF